MLCRPGSNKSGLAILQHFNMSAQSVPGGRVGYDIFIVIYIAGKYQMNIFNISFRQRRQNDFFYYALFKKTENFIKIESEIVIHPFINSGRFRSEERRVGKECRSG